MSQDTVSRSERVPPAQSDPGRGLPTRGDWAVILGALFLGLTLHTWFATFGTWKILAPEPGSVYYDNLGQSLLRGSFAVSIESIGGEAIYYNDKIYGYFAFAPAVPRIVLDGLWPQLYGLWGRLSVLLAAAAHVVLVSLILVRFGCRLWKPLPLLFLAAATAGGTLDYIVSHCFIYHEAIIWGAAFSLGTAYLAICCLLRPSFGLAAGAGACGVISSWCRVPAGAAALLACGVVLAATIARIAHYRPQHPRKRGVKRVVPPRQASLRSLELQTAVLGAAILLGFTSYVWMNRVKFGTYLNGTPVPYMANYFGERAARLGGTLFHPELAPRIAWAYLSPFAFQIRPVFPWFAYASMRQWQPPPKGFDSAEACAGLLAFAPGFVLLAVVGVVWGVRRYHERRWLRYLVLMLGTIFPGVCCFAFISQRYQHDWFPFLAVAGALGVAWLENGGAVRWRRTQKVVAGVLLFWSIPAGLSLALIFQRENSPWVPKERKVEYHRFQERVDHLFQLRPPAAGTPKQP